MGRLWSITNSGLYNSTAIGIHKIRVQSSFTQSSHLSNRRIICVHLILHLIHLLKLLISTSISPSIINKTTDKRRTSAN